MYDKLFLSFAGLARHKSEPYFEERERFVEHCALEGYTHETLLVIARRLLWVARKLSVHPDLLKVGPEHLEAMAQEYANRRGPRLIQKPENARESFVRTATQWLRYLGYFQETTRDPVPFANLIEDFSNWMDTERGLSERTISTYSFFIAAFLSWYGSTKRPISEVDVKDVDVFITANGGTRWCRVTVKHCVTALRTFLKYGGIQGWCRRSIADGILSPRVFAQETVPAGPSWRDVQRLLASMETEKPDDIRDRAIGMLFAIYGLRASEVSMIRLEDLNWEQNQILIRRSKQRKLQSYPLMDIVGNAIIRYLETVRPRCTRREVFLTLTAPSRRISRSALHGLIRKRMLNLGIEASHKGPHALRHACAAHLLSQGFSLKEIGDHLGHRSSTATQIYAKVDLKGLREVADFDLGGLL